MFRASFIFLGPPLLQTRETPISSYLSTSRSSLPLLSESVSTLTFTFNSSNQTLLDPIQWLLFIFLSIFLTINIFSSFMGRLKSQTDFTMEPKNSSISSDREPSKTTAASSAHTRPNRKSTASSAMVMKPNGKSAVSSAILKKPNASTAVSSAHDDQVMFFRDVSLGPTEAVLRFRLVHFWEATRKPSLDRR